MAVTGAPASLGRAIIRAFARQSAHIGVLARGRDGLEGTQRDVEALGVKALVISAGVADAKGIEQATEAMAGAGLAGFTLGAFLKRTLAKKA